MLLSFRSLVAEASSSLTSAVVLTCWRKLDSSSVEGTPQSSLQELPPSQEVSSPGPSLITGTAASTGQRPRPAGLGEGSGHFAHLHVEDREPSARFRRLPEYGCHRPHRCGVAGRRERTADLAEKILRANPPGGVVERPMRSSSSPSLMRTLNRVLEDLDRGASE